MVLILVVLFHSFILYFELKSSQNGDYNMSGIQ